MASILAVRACTAATSLSSSDSGPYGLWVAIDETQQSQPAAPAPQDVGVDNNMEMEEEEEVAAAPADEVDDYFLDEIFGELFGPEDEAAAVEQEAGADQ